MPRFSSQNQARIRVYGGYVVIEFSRHFYKGKQKVIYYGQETLENRRRAEAALLKIQRDIAYNEFDFSLESYKPSYAVSSNSADSTTNSKTDNTKNNTTDSIDASVLEVPTLKHMLESFEQEYFLVHKENRKSLKTFQQHKEHIIRAFKYKDTLDFGLSKQEISNAIKLTEAGSHMRKVTVSSLRVFCKYFKIDYDFQGLSKGYEPVPRILPSDNEIEEAWYKIQIEKLPEHPKFQGNGESWGWIFAVIATYGLRPHEILAIDYEKSFKPPHYSLYIDEHLTQGTKTGSRLVFPIPITWVNLFDITNPKISYIKKFQANYGDNIRKFADRLSERARCKNIGFQIYNLRHRYAIRGHEEGFKVDDLARWMGHTVMMHTQTYQKYLDDETHFIVYKAGLEQLEKLKKIKEGRPSYAEQELHLKKANEYIQQLGAKLEIMRNELNS